METPPLIEERLLAQAQAQGCKDLTRWKLERWHKEDVIPRPTVEHLGYGRGTRSVYPAHTLDQILAVCRLLQQTRNFHVVRFQLWQEGYAIPLPILKQTIMRLVPPFRWKIPGRKAQKYAAAEQRVQQWLQQRPGRFSRFLRRQFAQKFEDFQSFLTLQLYLLHGIDLLFEPSVQQDEPSAADILAQGLGVQQWSFLPPDLSRDFQQVADQGLLSIPHMQAALAAATEAELRQAHERAEVVALFLEASNLLGWLPAWMQAHVEYTSDPALQALSLVFILHLTRHGYADNIDGLLETLRVQVPRLRAFRRMFAALQHELPFVAKALGTPQDLWQQIKNQSEPERSQYLAQKSALLREVYVAHQVELDAFWQAHPDLISALETGDPCTAWTS